MSSTLLAASAAQGPMARQGRRAARRPRDWTVGPGRSQGGQRHGLWIRNAIIAISCLLLKMLSTQHPLKMVWLICFFLLPLNDAYDAPVPPPANVNVIVSDALTLQLSWNHPSGYNPGTPLNPSRNSTLDQYRIYLGTSLGSFTLVTPLTSVYQVLCKCRHSNSG